MGSSVFRDVEVQPFLSHIEYLPSLLSALAAASKSAVVGWLLPPHFAGCCQRSAERGWPTCKGQTLSKLSQADLILRKGNCGTVP